MAIKPKQIVYSCL